MLDDELDISRGDMHRPAATRRAATSRARVDATLCWLGDAPLDPRARYLLRHTTREARARVERHRSPAGTLSTQDARAGAGSAAR